MTKIANRKHREPLTDTQLLLTITIFIFFGMYFAAMAIWAADSCAGSRCLICSTTTQRSSSWPAA